MRALSGAIITAAALIGLGLTAEGVGTRYASYYAHKGATADGATGGVGREVDLDSSHIKIHQMDNALKVILTVLVLSLLIGLGITFVGLMYHHHRRHHEHLRGHSTGITSGTHAPM